jgi:hypothetical protein
MFDLWRGVSAIRVGRTPPCPTRSGYGKRLPTRYEVLLGSRWHRVWVMCWSNVGTAYLRVGGETRTDIDEIETLCERAGRLGEGTYYCDPRNARSYSTLANYPNMYSVPLYQGCANA